MRPLYIAPSVEIDKKLCDDKIIKFNRRCFFMKLRKMVSKLMSFGVLNSLALVLVAQNVNQTCSWFFHQPEAPESADCFKRH